MAPRLPPTVGLAARPDPFSRVWGQAEHLPGGACPLSGWRSTERATSALKRTRLAELGFGRRVRFKTSASAWLSSTAPSAKGSGSGSSLVLTARLRPSGLALRRTAAPTVGGRRLRLKHDEGNGRRLAARPHRPTQGDEPAAFAGTANAAGDTKSPAGEKPGGAARTRVKGKDGRQTAGGSPRQACQARYPREGTGRGHRDTPQAAGRCRRGPHDRRHRRP